MSAEVQPPIPKPYPCLRQPRQTLNPETLKFLKTPRRNLRYLDLYDAPWRASPQSDFPFQSPRPNWAIERSDLDLKKILRKATMIERFYGFEKES